MTPKLWAVYRMRGQDSVIVYVCANKKVAESYRDYERIVDIEGPALFISEIELKSVERSLPDDKDLW